MFAGSFSKFELNLAAIYVRMANASANTSAIPHPDGRVARSIREVQCAHVLFHTTHARLIKSTASAIVSCVSELAHVSSKSSNEE